ncbi:MAG: hypothetical protein ACI81P_002712 [Neolewinella sp.]|jgi:hypothetical protein
MLFSQKTKKGAQSANLAVEQEEASVAEQLRIRWLAIGPKAGVLLIPFGLAAVVAISPDTGKIFLKELVIVSLILLALLFIKASNTK